MNLVIDVGNTLVKLAVFQQDKLLEKIKAEKELLKKEMEKISEKYQGIRGVIVSDVSGVGSWPDFFKDVPVLFLNQNLELPFVNKYGTPESLGNDRKCLVAAAALKYPNRNVLIIDAGTCITYDIKDSHNNYFGGAISPGLRMRFKSLNHFTANLPLIHVEEDYELIGSSTSGAMNTGVVMGTLNEIDGFIDAYGAQYDDLLTIITGGDAQFLSINLKNGIFANSNFLLEGLNQILEFNISR